MNSLLEVDDSDSDSEPELDINWINEFEKLDKEYKHFYTEDCHSIKMHNIYIDKHKNIETIKKEIFFLKNNTIPKEEMLQLIKNNSYYNSKKYSILSILQFNIDIEPANIKSFLRKDKNYDFLKQINHISIVPYAKTIYMFQDLNDLFFIFFENTHSTTRKIYISQSLHKKTIRNKKA